MIAKALVRPKFAMLLTLGLLLVLMLAPAAKAAVWTDQLDYAPGSIVTFLGSYDESLPGWAPGAMVTVDIVGPLGIPYSAIPTIIGDDGSWQTTYALPDDPVFAVGEYTYSASASDSSVTQVGSFTDAQLALGAFNSMSNPYASGGTNFQQTVSYSDASTGGNKSLYWRVTLGTDYTGTVLDEGKIANTSASGTIQVNVTLAGLGQHTVAISITQKEKNNPPVVNWDSSAIFKSTTFTITTKAASVTADAGQHKTYGSADPALTTTNSGFDPADLGEGKITFSASRAGGNTVGTYTITPTASDGTSNLLSNYGVTYNKADFTITPKAASVSAVANTKVYGESDPALGTTNEGFLTDDVGEGKITFSATRAPGETVLGSPYLITPAASDGDTTLLDNYTVGYSHTADFTINKKELSVNAVADSKTYGAADPAFTWTYSGFVTDEDATNVTITGAAATSRTAGETVAGSPYKITCAPGTLLAANYSFATGTKADFTINARPITVTAITDTKVYDGNLLSSLTSIVPTVDGTLAPGDTADFSQIFETKDVTTGITLIPAGCVRKSDVDNNANYDISWYTVATGEITTRALTITANSTNKVYGTLLTFAGTEFTTSGQAPGESVASVTLTSAGRYAAAAVGDYAIVPSDPVAGPNTLLTNYAITPKNGTLTVTKATTETTLTLSGHQVHFMDQITLTADVKPKNTQTALTGTVTFTSSNPNYSSGNPDSKPLTVIQRDASPYLATGYYTGDLFVWTTGPSSSTATITLTAMIKDANMPDGDLRAAKVTFYLVNGTSMTPISSAKNLPVGLIDAGNGKVGTASAIAQLNIGSANAAAYRIAVGISGAYKNDPWDALSESTLTVAKPLPGGLIVGGGTLLNSASAGLLKGANGLFTNYQFDVAYNKSLTNPQGKVMIDFVSYYKLSGILDNVLHSYRITSNSISLLAVTAPKANFSSKANLVEVLAGGSTVGVESGTILQLAMTSGTSVTNPGSLAISFQRKAGGLWFSSKWDAGTGKTIEQLVSGGMVSVK